MTSTAFALVRPGIHFYLKPNHIGVKHSLMYGGVVEVCLYFETVLFLKTGSRSDRFFKTGSRSNLFEEKRIQIQPFCRKLDPGQPFFLKKKTDSDRTNKSRSGSATLVKKCAHFRSMVLLQYCSLVVHLAHY